MKTNLLLALILCACTSLFGQQLDINWGESFDSKTEVEKIIGSSGTTMVTLSSKGKKRYLETYNTSKGYKQIGSTEYIVPEIKGKVTGLLNIALRGDKIFALVYGYDKKAKAFSIHTQYLTLAGKPSGKMEEVYASDAADEKIRDRIVDVRFSPNSNYALMFFDRTNADRTTFYSDVVIMNLKDAKASIQTEQYSFPMRESKSESVNYKMYHSIDNAGSYFFMTERVELASKVISDFTLSVKGYDVKGKLIGETDIKDDERVLLSPAIISNNGKYVVVGYYMNNPKKRANISGYAGLFSARLNGDLSVEDLKIEKFSDEFFENLYSKKKIERMNSKSKEILVPVPYTIDQIVAHADGSLTVLSEFYTVVVTQSKQGKTTTTTYGNIIYYKINNEGKIFASDVIKKLQSSSTQTISAGVGFASGLDMFVSYETKDKRKKYWSYAMTTDGENVFLIFNDNVKNANDDDDELSKALTNPAKGVPFLATISENGTFTKKAMSDSQDTDTYCVPQVIYNQEDGSFIIWGVRRKENKFGVASIKD